MTDVDYTSAGPTSVQVAIAHTRAVIREMWLRTSERRCYELRLEMWDASISLYPGEVRNLYTKAYVAVCNMPTGPGMTSKEQLDFLSQWFTSKATIDTVAWTLFAQTADILWEGDDVDG